MGWVSTYHRGNSSRIRGNTASASSPPRRWKPSNPSIFYSSLKGFPQSGLRPPTDPKHSPLPLRGALPDGPDHHAQSAPSAPSAALVLLIGDGVPVNPLLADPLRTGALFRLAEMNLPKKESEISSASLSREREAQRVDSWYYLDRSKSNGGKKRASWRATPNFLPSPSLALLKRMDWRRRARDGLGEERAQMGAKSPSTLPPHLNN